MKLVSFCPPFFLFFFPFAQAVPEPTAPAPSSFPFGGRADQTPWLQNSFSSSSIWHFGRLFRRLLCLWLWSCV